MECTGQHHHAAKRGHVAYDLACYRDGCLRDSLFPRVPAWLVRCSTRSLQREGRDDSARVGGPASHQKVDSLIVPAVVSCLASAAVVYSRRSCLGISSADTLCTTKPIRRFPELPHARENSNTTRQRPKRPPAAPLGSSCFCFWKGQF